MVTIEEVNYLDRVKVWTLDRDGDNWTLRAWEKAPGREAAVKRKYAVDSEPDMWKAMARLARLAQHEMETTR